MGLERNAESAGGERPVVVYDGDCPFCRGQIERLRRLDRATRFECVPRQQPGLEARFPALADGDFRTGMRIVLPGGRIRVGADAVYEIARRLPGWRCVAWVYRVPGLRAIFRGVYAWIARNRFRLAAACDDGSCPAPGRAADDL